MDYAIIVGHIPDGYPKKMEPSVDCAYLLHVCTRRLLLGYFVYPKRWCCRFTATWLDF